MLYPLFESIFIDVLNTRAPVTTKIVRANIHQFIAKPLKKTMLTRSKIKNDLKMVMIMELIHGKTTYEWHTSTYEWHTHSIQVHTSDKQMTYEWHTNDTDDVRVHADDMRVA